MPTLRDSFLGGTFRQQPAMGAVRAGIDESIGRERQRAALEAQEQDVEFAPAREERAIAGEERAAGAAQQSASIKAAEELRKAGKAEREDALNVAGVVGSIEDEDDIAAAVLLHPKDLADLNVDTLAAHQDRSNLILSGERLNNQKQNVATDAFKGLIKDLSPQDQLKAVRQKLFLDPKPTSGKLVNRGGLLGTVDPQTSQFTPAIGPGDKPITAEDIGAAGAVVKEAEKFGADVGAQRAKTIKDSFDTIRNTEKSIKSLGRVKDAIKKGAVTGVVANWFPTFRRETVALQSAVNAAGLDIISSVTFGALSKGELDLSLDTAVPTGIVGDELVKWVDERIAAKEKLIAYLDGQMSFIDAGGTLTEWRQEQKALQDQQPQGPRRIKLDIEGN